GNELLRHAAAEEHARAFHRLRAYQFRRNAAEYRGRERAFREFCALRYYDARHRSRAHHGERFAAAWVPRGRDRRRILLGRWPDLEHAAAMGRGLRLFQGHSYVSGGPLELTR